MKRLIGLCLICALLSCACAETQFADCSSGFAFLPSGVEWTDRSYRSENMSIEITAQRACDSDVYVADLRLRTAECLRRSFGDDEWNASSEKITTHAEKNGAVLALTGDNGHHLKAGWEVGNGVLWRKRGNNMRDLCVVYTDGTMQIHYAPADYDLIARQTQEGLIWQTFVFGPALLDADGKAFADFSASNVEPKNPRAVIGYYGPGHFCLVQVDGRSTGSALEEKAINHGMTLLELAQFMESLGCKAAYNLDGGQTAVMWFRDGVISTPYNNGRAMGDAIVICEPGAVKENMEDFLVE